MSKSKNSRKAVKGKSLNDNPIIPRGEFSIETAKNHLIAVIICFHILPLVFLAFGDEGRELLQTGCLVYLNPMFIFVIMLLYGVRIGFNFKMPIITTLLAAASVAMYYTKPEQADYVYYTLTSTAVMFFVYCFFSYLSTVAGAIIKHFITR